MPAKSKPGPYHHGDLRNALLDAALTLLTESGQDAVTTRACAKAVGCAPSAVFRHFADRRALTTALATQGYRRLGKRMDQARADASDDGQMQALAEAYLDFALAEPHLFRLMFQGDQIDLNDEALLSASEPLLDLTAPNDPDLAILSWAVVHGLASLAIDSQLERQLPADRDDRRAALSRILGRTAPLFSPERQN